MTIYALIGGHKHMYGKITTFTFGGITSVSIARFECTKDRILNILNLLNIKMQSLKLAALKNECSFSNNKNT